ncbi:ferredoxin-thioredoxin reductase catalytic domain-containing protein [Methanogenium organophilum]|uniref:ferredoxin:thioredoxin reductase n=1 Tax=Methanogenium organophilum TaxID=2199 RepID=A0A9X9S2Y8_METOG|nr:ferredoxin-thioredoxin reductase catalytic domain-containing protein [Methanogenium organophilum]WAI00929.1 ferredoxin:glutaredoxin reductase [Methanogenium organophilum]
MINRFDIERRYLAIKKQAEQSGYHLHPDEDYAKDLVHGIVTNEERYGFAACPCRLSIGTREDNLDIICPCDYRDQDLTEYGVCYCALYVSKEVAAGKIPVPSIPDRRPSPDKREITAGKEAGGQKVSILTGDHSLPYPIFRCRVCGYLCARTSPPENCPICGASSDRFEKYIE